MLDQNVFEHIAADRVHDCAVAVLVDDSTMRVCCWFPSVSISKRMTIDLHNLNSEGQLLLRSHA